jgi:nucleoid-associated protein Lsr2
MAHPVTGVGVARRTIVTIEDDLDGGPADETLRFGIGGWEYEIDLSRKNAARFRKQLAPFIEHARKAGRTPPRPRRTVASRQRSRDIRVWAKEQGIELSERGRIPASVADQYETAIRGTSHGLPVSLRGRGPRRKRPSTVAATGPDRLVVVVKPGNAGGAKGTGHPGLYGGQPDMPGGAG